MANTTVAISDVGTFLAYKNGGTYSYLIGITSVPATGGNPQQIEVTEMDCPYKQYISARQDTPAFEFGFNYTDANFKKLKDLKGVQTDYALIFNDGSGITFTGIADYWTEGFSANQAIKAKLSISVTKKEFKNASEMKALISTLANIPEGREKYVPKV